MGVTDVTDELRGAAMGVVAAATRAATRADPGNRFNSGSIDYCVCWVARAAKPGNITIQVLVCLTTAVTRAAEGSDRLARTVRTVILTVLTGLICVSHAPPAQ